MRCLALASLLLVLLPGIGVVAPVAAMELDAAPSTFDCQVQRAPAAFPVTASKYRAGDATRSVEDPDLAAMRQTALEPIRRFVRTTARLGERFANDRADLRAAACGVAGLVEWAEAGSFLDLDGEDAHLSRDVLVADLALAYRRFSAGRVEPADRRAIETWFQAIGADVVRFYDEQAGPRSRLNNHRYWAGVAVSTIAAVTRDPALRGWGRRTLALGLRQIQTDGTLPLERLRGTRSLQYHVYALRALVALAELHPDVAADAELDRLRRLVVDWGLRDRHSGWGRQEPLSGASLAFVRALAAPRPIEVSSLDLSRLTLDGRR